MDKVMVSIFCITYNHEGYIMEALDSFLAQKVNFDYEIIIHDDASTDKTAEIIRDYEVKYPDLIRAIYQKENQYSKKKNFHFLECAYTTCKGKYIAICEGDDFWIDTNKLQTQIDFMESNPEYVLTIHNALRLCHLDRTIKSMDPFDHEGEISAEEIIMLYNGMIPTASMVMRTDVLEIRNLFGGCGVGDWPLQLWCLEKGKIYYFNRIMSVYRFLHEGSWNEAYERDYHKRFSHSMEMVEFLKRFDQYTNYKFSKYLFSRIQRYVYLILEVDGRDRELLKKICGQYDKEDSYIREIKRLSMLLYNESHEEDHINEFIKMHRHIVLFGAGDYASRLIKQLNEHNIFFDGFTVSEPKTGEEECWGKPVWKLSRFPFGFDDVGVIVAIKPVMWNQIVDLMEENSITEYMCPFLFDV